MLAFVASLLLNVLDAVFVCFAMDRDRETVTRPEVHEVYSQLPSVGKMVEAPEGEGVAYARPLAAEEGAYYPPGHGYPPVHRT